MRIRRVLQILFFLLTSVIEVHVRADDLINFPQVTKPIEIPDNCLLENAVCTIKTVPRHKYELDLEQTKLVLSSDTVFTRLSATSGAVVQGIIFVKTKEKFVLETPYGKLQSHDGEFLVYHQAKNVLVRVLNGEVVMQPRGHDQFVTVSAGLENWISRVDVSGRATVGIVMAVNPKAVIKDLSPIFPGTRSEFLTFMKVLRETWSSSIKESAVVYESLVKRNIASEEDRQKQKKLAQKRWQQERDSLRAILLKRTFE